MRGLLCRFGHVHQIATTTTMNNPARWITTLSTRFDNTNEFSARGARSTLNSSDDSVTWRCPRNEDANAIFKTPDARSTSSQRIDENNDLFSFT
jgi:hypothetical protein